MNLPEEFKAPSEPGLSREGMPFLDPAAYGQFLCLMDQLPGVSFFAKNESSVITFASKSMAGRYGLRSAEEVVGKCDHDFFPAYLADGFIRDDRLVMATGDSLVSRVEALFDENGIFGWYATSKYPLHDCHGGIIGVMGITRSVEEKRGMVFPDSRVRKAVETIEVNFGEKLVVAELARMSSLSQRQFRRQFQETYAMSPQEFIMRTRIRNSCSLLKNTGKSIAEVAMDCGFCDQSSFTQQFRKCLGVTPLQFRKGGARSAGL